MANVLASLASAGILERAGSRRTLRVTPRFLAHAEGTAGRLRLLGHPDPALVLREALGSWDAYRHDLADGTTALMGFLADHDQFGALRPVFNACVAA